MLFDVIKEQEFYNNTPFYFSYSSLNTLMWDPYTFYKTYILKEREEKISPALIQGKVIHALLLKEDEFDDMFIISPDNLPTGNNKLLIDRIYYHHNSLCKESADVDNPDRDNNRNNYELSDYSKEILNALVEIDLHQSLKDEKGSKDNLIPLTGDQKRLAKIITDETNSYWNFLKQRERKTLIDRTTYDYCVECVNIIRNNNKAFKLLGMSEFSNVQIFNEIELKKELAKFPFGLKGIIDNLVIDDENKVIYINDLTTPSKSLRDFPESVEFYSYWLQCSIYSTLVHYCYEELINKGYIVEFHFIVLDCNKRIYCFKVSEKTRTLWFERTIEILIKANHHYTDNKWELPYEFSSKEYVL